jgi:hypothetical protein
MFMGLDLDASIVAFDGHDANDQRDRRMAGNRIPTMASPCFPAG